MINAKRVRRWSIASIVTATVGLGCSDDELPPESGSGAEAGDGMEGVDEQGGEGDSESECGNGRLDQGEECDDGNATQGDACTNACMLPTCGDGIVHTDAGEDCDDGNLDPGDGCTSWCHLRGAEMANHTSDWFTLGTAAAVDASDRITILGRAKGESWIAKFDSKFATQWSGIALPGNPPALANGTEDELLISGKIGDQARTKRINPDDGTDVWLGGIPYQASTFSSVAAAGEHMVAAGYFGVMFHEHGVLVRHDRKSGVVLATLEWEDGPFGPVAVDEQGWIWVIDSDKDAQLRIYDADDQLQDTVGLIDAVYEDIIVDAERNVYILARSMGKQSFMLWKYKPDGAVAWSPQKHPDAGASGFALTPNGAVIIAGYTSDESNGLLAWYDQESGEFIHEIVVGSDGVEGEFEVFEDVAVSKSGEYAVAVGGRGLSPASTALWIYKVEL